MDQGQTPLFSALVEHSRRSRLPFHVPGHKAGREIRGDLLAAWGAGVFTYDVTELDGLDDLHAPRGVIAESEALAASAVGAASSCLLTSGATTGLLAALLAVCSPAEQVLVPRNVHRSVIAGLILAGAEPVFVWPSTEEDTDVMGPLDLSLVREKLQQHSRVKTMVVLHPTYFGNVGNAKGLMDLAVERGLKVIVDEAHGAHFPFSQHFPASALQLGAQIVVQGWHKTLGALTGGAMLHCSQEATGLMGRIRMFLRMIHTTSPSYLVMASLDVARSQAATAPAVRWQRASEYHEDLCVLMGESSLVSVHWTRTGAHDPLKLGLKPHGFSARDLARELTRLGVHSELATERVCLLILGTASEARVGAVDLARTIIAAAEQARRTADRVSDIDQGVLWQLRPQVRMALRTAASSASCLTPLIQAGGRVSADILVLYPPGTVIRCPGEVIDVETIEVMLKMLEKGYSFHGVGPPPDYRISVVTDRC